MLIVLKLQFLVSNWSRTFGRSPEQRVFPYLWVYLSIVFRGIGLPGRAVLRMAFVILWVHVFVEFMAIDLLKFVKGPWSLRGSRGYAPHGYVVLMVGHAACCTQYTRCCPFGPCTGAHSLPKSSMRKILALGEVVTVLAWGASKASRRYV